jgi:1-acyl-sn-glycerol-3-phosphate acyltransferase
VQGWLLRRLGCFPVNQTRPNLASLRYAIDLLAGGQQLVVFPEGQIHREDGPIALQQGPTRLALLFASQGETVPVVPVGIGYSHPEPRPGDAAALCFGKPLHAEGHGRAAALTFTESLAVAMRSAEQAAREAIGHPLVSP